MKKPIRIFDGSFNMLGEIDDYESLIFIRRFYGVGEFELHININKNNVESLQEDNIIMLAGDTHKLGIIRHREIKLDENGDVSEELLVTGYEVKSLVSRRITIPPVGQSQHVVNSNAETIMKTYVDANCINPVDPNRVIPNLVLATNGNRGMTYKEYTRLKQLDEEIIKIATYTGLGWEIYLDLPNKKLVFDVIVPRNLTAEQTTLPPVIFSTDFDNIKGQHFVDSALGMRNFAYVGGQGEGVDREIVTVGTATGLNRVETFVDARDMDDGLSLPARGEHGLSASAAR